MKSVRLAIVAGSVFASSAVMAQASAYALDAQGSAAECRDTAALTITAN